MIRTPRAVEMDVVVGAEGARRATGDSGPMTTSRATAPDPEALAVDSRLRILKLADACKKPGDVGALLRREGLYSSHLTHWRQQRERGSLAEAASHHQRLTGTNLCTRLPPLDSAV